MKQKMLWILVTLLLLQVSMMAQNDSTRNETQFKLGVFHNTNLNYYGRTDSLQSSGFFPLAELWFTRNIYISAAPVFVHNPVQNFEYAGTIITAGYQFYDKKKWSGNFYVVKPLYQDNSQLVQSAVKAQVSGTVTRQGKLLNMTMGGDIKFSDHTDYGITAGIDHLFKIAGPPGIVVVIDPSVFLYAGTQQFTHTYYKESNFILLPGGVQEVTRNVKKFNILSYELSMPVVLAKGKFQLLLIPAYVLPQNLVSVAGRPDLSERGKNLFYATLGAKISF